MECVDDHSASLADDPIPSMSAVDATPRTRVNSTRVSSLGGQEQAEKIVDGTMHDILCRGLSTPDQKELGRFSFDRN